MFDYEFIEGEWQLTARVDLDGIDWKNPADFERRWAEACEKLDRLQAVIDAENVIPFPGAWARGSQAALPD